MENSLWIAFLALAVAVGIPLLTERQKQKTRKMEWHEARLRWQRDYYNDLMYKLIDLRAQLQFLQNKGGELEREREVAYGSAFAIMLTVRKGKMRGKASDVMQFGVTPEDLERKNKAIEEAIEELGDLVEEANNKLVPGSQID